MKKQDEGFTLIELLIVIVILGILATVVVFAVGGITDQGQESACEAELKTVEVAYRGVPRPGGPVRGQLSDPAGLLLAQRSEAVRSRRPERHQHDGRRCHRWLPHLVPLINNE